MAEGRKTKLKDTLEHRPEMKVELAGEPANPAAKRLTPEQLYLQRKAEVLQQDNGDFSRYLQEKSARDRQQAAEAANASQKPSATWQG